MRNQVTIIGVSESVKQLRAFNKALRDLSGRKDKLIIDVYESESQYQRSREKAKLKFNTNMLQELFVVMGEAHLLPSRKVYNEALNNGLPFAERQRYMMLNASRWVRPLLKGLYEQMPRERARVSKAPKGAYRQTVGSSQLASYKALRSNDAISSMTNFSMLQLLIPIIR